jgi:hypothetical protein
MNNHFPSINIFGVSMGSNILPIGGDPVSDIQDFEKYSDGQVFNNTIVDTSDIGSISQMELDHVNTSIYEDFEQYNLGALTLSGAELTQYETPYDSTVVVTISTV